MKIHYDKDITKSYYVTELHYTNTIELDGVKLIPITELENLKTEIRHKSYMQEEYGDISVNTVMWIIDKYISKLKGSE